MVQFPVPVAVSKSVNRSVRLHENVGVSLSRSVESQSTIRFRSTKSSTSETFVIVIGLLGICVFCDVLPVESVPVPLAL